VNEIFAPLRLIIVLCNSSARRLPAAFVFSSEAGRRGVCLGSSGGGAAPATQEFGHFTGAAVDTTRRLAPRKCARRRFIPGRHLIPNGQQRSLREMPVAGRFEGTITSGSPLAEGRRRGSSTRNSLSMMHGDAPIATTRRQSPEKQLLGNERHEQRGCAIGMPGPTRRPDVNNPSRNGTPQPMRALFGRRPGIAGLHRRVRIAIGCDSSTTS
jgi:hypothetical protein